MRTHQSIGSKTAVPIDGWQEVRQGGKLLFEFHPQARLIRIVRNRRVFLVSLIDLHDH